MAGTNPIIDLATINDLQTRLASIEAALGKYNAANAVTGASEVPTNPSGTGSSYVPTQDSIQSGSSTSFIIKNPKNGFSTGTMTVQFATPFTSAPIVIAVATGQDSSGLPLMLSTTVGKVTSSSFQVRVTNLSGASSETVSIQYIAITRK